jgi:hypothetical protein
MTQKASAGVWFPTWAEKLQQQRFSPAPRKELADQSWGIATYSWGFRQLRLPSGASATRGGDSQPPGLGACGRLCGWKRIGCARPVSWYEAKLCIGRDAITEWLKHPRDYRLSTA